jgi:hypothetical protein
MIKQFPRLGEKQGGQKKPLVQGVKTKCNMPVYASLIT